ncbi:hypothetical protein yaldo0001_2170 [Yersinia aldovae ATCC 35236]|nr:hypothetical protein yaldo0001_2170 [Yersinia aldovae ATCC 35236]
MGYQLGYNLVQKSIISLIRKTAQRLHYPVDTILRACWLVGDPTAILTKN